MSQVQVQDAVDVTRLVGNWIPMYSSFPLKDHVHTIEISANGGIRFKNTGYDVFDRTFIRANEDSLDGHFVDEPSTCCFCIKVEPEEFDIVQTDYTRYLITCLNINTGDNKLMKVDLYVRDKNLRNDTALLLQLSKVIEDKCEKPWDEMHFIL